MKLLTLCFLRCEIRVKSIRFYNIRWKKHFLSLVLIIQLPVLSMQLNQFACSVSLEAFLKVRSFTTF